MKVAERLRVQLRRVPDEEFTVFPEAANEQLERVRKLWSPSYAHLDPLRMSSSQAVKLEEVQRAADKLARALSQLDREGTARLLRAGDECGWQHPRLPVHIMDARLLGRMAEQALSERVPSGRPVDHKHRRECEAVVRARNRTGIDKYYARSASHESPFGVTLGIRTGKTPSHKVVNDVAHDLCMHPVLWPSPPHRSLTAAIGSTTGER